MKILIAGRTASGKDHFVRLLEKNGLTSVQSRTTRPKRGENDNSHLFVSKEEAAQQINRIAETTINGYDYYVLKEDLQHKDLYVIDPNGIMNLIANMPEETFLLVYMEASEQTRKQRYMDRLYQHNANISMAKANEEFLARQSSEDEQFSWFEDQFIHPSDEAMNDESYLDFRQRIAGILFVENDKDTSEQLEDAVKKLLAELETIRTVKQYIQELQDAGIIQSDPDIEGNVLVAMLKKNATDPNDVEFKSQTLEQFTCQALGDYEGFGHVMRSYFTFKAQDNIQKDFKY